MFQRHLLAQSIWASLTLTLMAPTALAAEQARTDNSNTEDAEVITVTGVRSSLRDAAFLKKSAEQIMDAISAEDIGQLPDNNIAEALQRVTGIQIGRDDSGQGSSFQVRGLSQNRVEVNGQSMASSGESRSNSFDAVDPALFKAIEVIKSPTADMVEGAVGATVRLKTFNPLDFKKPVVNASLQGAKDELADDPSYKATLMGTTSWETENFGRIGILLNGTLSEDNRESHSLDSNWAPALKAQTVGINELEGKAIFRPNGIKVQRRPFSDEKQSLDMAVQWELNDRVQFNVNANRMEAERYNESQSLNFQTAHVNNVIFPADMAETPFWDESWQLLTGYGRAAQSGEGLLSEDENGLPVLNSPDGQLNRYFMTRATVEPVTTGFNAPVNGNQAASYSYTVQSTFQVGTDLALTDDLMMKLVYATATSEEEEKNRGVNYDPTENIYDDSETDGEDLLDIGRAWTYYDFANGRQLPTVGVISPGQGVGEATNTLLNPDVYNFATFFGTDTVKKNQKQSLALDFDWLVDGDFITKYEFGLRVAKNEVNRRRSQMRYGATKDFSIFSNNWRAFDRDTTTQTSNGANTGAPKTTFAFVDQVMAEEHGQQNYLGRHLKQVEELFPNSDNSALPSWLFLDLNLDGFERLIADFFPGRNGDCERTDINACKALGLYQEYPKDYQGTQEWNAVMQLPAATLFEDESYPYRIQESTYAAYFKLSFQSDFDLFGYNIGYLGNAGIRYVKTEVDGLGVLTSRLYEEGNPVKDYEGQQLRNYEPITTYNEYTNLLPSANINFLLTESMFLRFAYAKTMSRPAPVDLSPSENINPEAFSGSSGNPALIPEEADSYDLSWEWYISDINQLSAAIFVKELSNFLMDDEYTLIPNSGSNETDQIITVKTKINGGSGTIQGAEVSFNHAFDYLPSVLSGLGITANYTRTDSSQGSGFSEVNGESLPVPNLSENSYNFVLFYDKYGFNFRAAYNYRDSSFDNFGVVGRDPTYSEISRGIDGNIQYSEDGIIIYKPLSIKTPVWKDEFETLDISTSYRFKNGTTLFLQATNVLAEPNKRYVGVKDETTHLLRSYNETGAFYIAGVRARF